MPPPDLIIYNVGQLVTCASGRGPKRGSEMLDMGIVADGAVTVSNGIVTAVGSSEEMLTGCTGTNAIDAGGRVVCPGFVDPHTHIVFAGHRLNEFELKIRGDSYLEILAAGGGIISTVEQTRAAAEHELVEQSSHRLDKMLAHGTTTAEVKTGYGLDLKTEVKILDVMAQLDARHAIDIVPTFLAAHAIPGEYKKDPDAYVDLICDSMLGKAWDWYVESAFYGERPFCCDVFCDGGAFSLEQSERILKKARQIGFGIKAHVDEFTNLGGSRMSLQLGAISIDHLDAISTDEVDLLAASETIGVVTPTVNFNFGSSHFADARALIDKGCAVAVSTDYNPGSAPCPSQQTAMAIACRYQKLLPAEAMNASTINAAYAAGVGDRYGSIEVGKQADLLMMDTDDYRQIAYEFGGNLVRSVVKNGREIFNSDRRL
ncbi:MAG: imidazolonepropionase [Pyrinomonadaceae bacterium]